MIVAFNLKIPVHIYQLTKKNMGGAFSSSSMCPNVPIVVHNICQVYFSKVELKGLNIVLLKMAMPLKQIT